MNDDDEVPAVDRCPRCGRFIPAYASSMLIGLALDQHYREACRNA